MSWAWKRLTRNVSEILSLEQAKTHLAVGHSDDDNLITDAIGAALTYCEEYTGRVFGEKTYLVTGSCWDGYEIHFPIEPVASIESVKYVDSDGAEQTVDAENYRTWLDHSPPILRFVSGFSMPSLDINEPAPIRIEVVAGEPEIPEILRSAMLLLLGYWRQFPGGEPSLGHLSRGAPAGCDNLLDKLWTGAQ